MLRNNIKFYEQGDSGGGFFVEQNNRYSIHGIVSAGKLKGDFCDPDKLVVFTNVSKFIDWIRSVLVRMTTCYQCGLAGAKAINFSELILLFIERKVSYTNFFSAIKSLQTSK